MRVAVLGSPNGWHYEDLARAAGKTVRLHPAAFTELAAEVRQGEVRVSSGAARLDQFDSFGRRNTCGKRALAGGAFPRGNTKTNA